MPPTSPMVIGIVLAAIGFIVAGGLLVVALRQRHVDADTRMADLAAPGSSPRRPRPVRSARPSSVSAAFGHSRIHDDRWREHEERSG